MNNSANKHLWLGVSALIAVLGAGAAGVSYYSEESRAVRLCEADMIEMLRVPSSYNRLSHKVTSTVGGTMYIEIKYEAANSFNARLRGSARCRALPQISIATIETMD